MEQVHSLLAFHKSTEIAMDLSISHNVSITTWDGEIPYTPFCMHGGIDSKPRFVLAWVHEEGTWLVVCILSLLGGACN